MSTFVYRQQFISTLTISFQKFLSFSLIYFLLLCAPVNADYDQTDATQVGFVAFAIGEYQQEEAGQIDYLIRQLKELPEGINIQLVGHSHSIDKFAKRSKAQARAKLVKDKLVEHGIKAGSISLHSDARNSVPQDQLIHGVSVYVLMLPKTELPPVAKSVNLEKPSIDNLSSEDQPLSIEDSSTESPITQIEDIPNSEEDIADPVSKNCAVVMFSKGSLAVNIEREINHCGYVMGQWKFGSVDDIIDWQIPLAYSTSVDKGIIGVLELIENNYQIRAHIHQLDKSIDFMPSIKNLGSYN